MTTSFDCDDRQTVVYCRVSSANQRADLAGSMGDVSLMLRPADLGHPVKVGNGGEPEVSGPAYALAAWLSGRSRGAGLTVKPAGPLPAIPEWA